MTPCIAVPVHRPFGDGAAADPVVIAAGQNAARVGELIAVLCMAL